METRSQSGNSHSLSAVRRGVETLNDKVDIVNAQLEILKLGLSPVPEHCGNMYYSNDARQHKLLELEKRHERHSADLRRLQNAVEGVHTENDFLREQMMKERGSHRDLYPRNEPVDVYKETLQDERTSNRSRSSESKQQIQDKGEYDKQATPQARPKEDTERDLTHPWRKLDRTNNRNEVGYQDTGAKQPSSRGKTPEFDFEEFQRQRRAQIYSCYDTTAINPQFYEQKQKHNKYPWYDHKTHPSPGGFLILRFDDEGYDVANVALKSQQSICRHAGGYLMGIARKGMIFVFENEPTKYRNWSISRNQPYKDCLMTDHALAVFWFTKKEAAGSFFENVHHNRFREPCFPTPNGHEAFYVPLCEPPTRQLNTFLCIEFLDAAKLYNPENLTQFEGEVREDMLRFFPNCTPMVVSSQTGRVVFKPGLLISPYSKLYISRFQSQRDVDDIWKSGMITGLRKKWKLDGPANVYSFTIDIAF